MPDPYAVLGTAAGILAFVGAFGLISMFSGPTAERTFRWFVTLLFIGFGSLLIAYVLFVLANV